jgi:hypothetical protein
MYVLKYTLSGPSYMVDYFYDEVISTHDGIALAIYEHNAQGMRKNGYDILGEIANADDLPKFLDGFKLQQSAAAAPAKIVKTETILSSGTPEPELIPKPWMETV